MSRETAEVAKTVVRKRDMIDRQRWHMMAFLHSHYPLDSINGIITHEIYENIGKKKPENQVSS